MTRDNSSWPGEHGPEPSTEEPSANSRQIARASRDVFVGLTQEGFTEQQALIIIGQCISASFQQGKSE